jgi:hypothetical protein
MIWHILHPNSLLWLVSHALLTTRWGGGGGLQEISPLSCDPWAIRPAPFRPSFWVQTIGSLHITSCRLYVHRRLAEYFSCSGTCSSCLFYTHFVCFPETVIRKRQLVCISIQLLHVYIVRFPMGPLKFFSDIILPVALWPWGRLSL